MTRKQIALDFLKRCGSGHAVEAFRLYVGEGFKHHNAYYKGDADTLMHAMDESYREHPDKIFEPLRSLEDGDLVAVHSKFRFKAEDLGYAIMHIFRFDGDKIVELWDFGAEVPKDMANENGMF